MKKSKIVRILAAVLVVVMCFSLSACGKDEAEVQKEQQVATANKEIRLNDYRGGITRTLALKDSVLNLMETMKGNNKVIREDNPDSFWTTDGYQEFVATFLATDIINDTQWFNEEQTTWENVIKKISSVENSFTKKGDEGYALDTKVQITRVEENDYVITGVTDKKIAPAMLTSDGITPSANAATVNYKILYDNDKDWCKAYAQFTIRPEIPAFTSQLFEYRRIDNNSFVIQTSDQRLLIILNDPVKAVNDKGETILDKEGKPVYKTDLRERTIKEFYYSKLSTTATRKSFIPFMPLDSSVPSSKTVNSEMEKHPYLNSTGDFALAYSVKDSIFKNLEKSRVRDWVFEEDSLAQAITYKDGALVVTTFNKLSESYERFIYTTKAKDENAKIVMQLVVSELEGLVDSDSLSGTDTPTVFPEEPTTVPEDTEPSTSPEESTTNQSTKEPSSSEDTTQ